MQASSSGNYIAEEAFKNSFVQQNRLELYNPTPYYLNITSLKIKNNLSNSNLKNQNNNIIQPFSKNEYNLKNKDFKISHSNQLSYNLIDDYGTHHSYTININ